ncbi:MAG: DUF3015 family protein [Bdellovibrionota bacterium]|jgi:hypothetical protein|nr:DUF3015 family protein [Bdellovibrionota bacterium]
MKKFLFTATLSLLVGNAFAAHGPAGCGLGAMLLKGKDGLVMNVLAATTNGTSGNQTFGMSTGTLGCEDANKAKVSGPAFIQNNREKLANDVARGQGETLSAYLKLIDASQTEASELQKNFASIFATENDANAIHNKIVELI